MNNCTNAWWIFSIFQCHVNSVISHCRILLPLVQRAKKNVYVPCVAKDIKNVVVLYALKHFWIGNGRIFHASHAEKCWNAATKKTCTQISSHKALFSFHTKSIPSSKITVVKTWFTNTFTRVQPAAIVNTQIGNQSHYLTVVFGQAILCQARLPVSGFLVEIHAHFGPTTKPIWCKYACEFVRQKYIYITEKNIDHKQASNKINTFILWLLPTGEKVNIAITG